jgi:hypothetical protein
MEFIDREKISEMQIQDVIGKLEIKESCSAANRKSGAVPEHKCSGSLKKGSDLCYRHATKESNEPGSVKRWVVVL